jgi:hypothetical protein
LECLDSEDGDVAVSNPVARSKQFGDWILPESN